MGQVMHIHTEIPSLSARRAWIEIHLVRNAQNGGRVALRKESVDRNYNEVYAACRQYVALRKESVDRNYSHAGELFDLLKSLSARRAWIEIILPLFGTSYSKVALRKESVDRNHTAEE